MTEAAGKPRRLRMTEADVARHLGVSRATVSRALHGRGRISVATRERVLAAADELGFVPNAMASELAAGRSDVVGLLLRDSANPAYGQLFDSLQTAARTRDLEIVSVTVSADVGGRRQVSGLRRLLGMRVSGLVIATGDVRTDQIVPFIDEVPMIRAGRPETDPRIDAVSYDEVGNAQLLADHVADLGHRAVAVITTSESVSYPEWVRATAMAAQLERRGVAVTRLDARASGDGVGKALDAVRAGAVTAVMCPTDLRQLEVLRGARAAGMSCPGDFSVTGCDGRLPGSDLLGLTSLRLPVEELAERTVIRLTELLDGPRGEPTHTLVRGALVEGTTAAAPST